MEESLKQKDQERERMVRAKPDFFKNVFVGYRLVRNCPSPRNGHSAVIYKDHLVLVGGLEQSSNFVNSKQIETLLVFNLSKSVACLLA